MRADEKTELEREIKTVLTDELDKKGWFVRTILKPFLDKLFEALLTAVVGFITKKYY